MKAISVPVSSEEYEMIKREASRLGVSVKYLVRNRVFGVDTEAAPIYTAKILADELADLREALNDLVRSEALSGVHLYDDDVVHLEDMLKNIEQSLAAFITKSIKEVKK